MKFLSCKNCGASMVIDTSGTTAVCPYCRTKSILDHSDTDYYLDFYEQMRGFFKLSKEGQERRIRSEELWNNASEEYFECKDGKQINVKSLNIYKNTEATVYTARQNVIFHFDKNKTINIDKFRKSVSSLDYPSADTKSLSDFFPVISGGFDLSDGSALLVIKKSEDEYPLRLFGSLSGRHVAWIISRLENLCCVLEYNSLVHTRLSIDNIYINPYDHTASLLGGWWHVVRNNTVIDGKSFTSRHNLFSIRDIAAYLLGYERVSEVSETQDIPKPFADFLKGVPETNAYDDFSYWDKVLIESYGERKFLTMDTDDEEIYGKR